MNDLEEILEFLVKGVDGATAAFIGSSDGLLIEQHPRKGQDYSAVAAQWTNVLAALTQVSKGLKAGGLKETMMTSEHLLAYVRIINQEIFCVVMMNPTGNIEKARSLSLQVSQNLIEVFA